MHVETILDLDDGRKRRKVIFNDVEQKNSESGEDDDLKEDEINENEDSDSGNEDAADDNSDDENDSVDEDEDETDEEDELSEESSDDEEKSLSQKSVASSKNNFGSMSDSDEDDNGIKWKTNLSQKAANAFIARQNTTANLWKLVYGKKYLNRWGRLSCK